MPSLKPTFCRICTPSCPLVAEVGDDGRIAALHPNREHPVSQGFACHKGLGYLDVHNDPDRVNYPLRRTAPRRAPAGGFERVTWDEAFAEIGKKLRAIRDRHGPDAIGVYAGNPIAFNSKAFAGAYTLAQRLGSRRAFNAATQDLSNRRAASLAIFGSVVTPIPDFYRTRFLLCIGANPKISKWTQTSLHRPLHVLHDIVGRGGQVVFVNPRQIETADHGLGEVVSIRPDTDVYLLAAMIEHIHAAGGFRDDVIARHGRNIEGLKRFVGRYPADRVAQVTGIAAEDIRRIAEAFMRADGAAVHSGTGINQGRQGTLASWLLHMLTFVTGNLGQEGGEYYSHGYAASTTHAAYKAEPAFNTEFGSMRLVAGALPGNLLADFVGLKDNPVRALLVLSGNPLLSIGGEARLREAFGDLELLVTVDLYRNSTGEMADFVLPAADWLERPDVNSVANGKQPTPYVQYVDAAVPPRFERRDDAWIIARLEQELGLLDRDAPLPDFLVGEARKLAAAGLSIDALRAMPSGTALLPQTPRDAFFEAAVLTEDRKVDCCPAAFDDALERSEAIFAELTAEDPSQLKLISLRTLNMHNGSLMNMRTLKRGRHAENPLHMNPGDAAARGLGAGDTACVASPSGEVLAPVELDETLRPGVVAMTHGYGHFGSPGTTLAAAHPGRNVNRLLPTGPGSYEPLSNMSHMNGVPVAVRRVEAAASDPV